MTLIIVSILIDYALQVRDNKDHLYANMAFDLPFTELVDAETGELKTDKELAEIITNAGIDTTLNTVNSCGSGVTACIVDLSLRLLGAEKTAIYDGSWSEYVSVL